MGDLRRGRAPMAARRRRSARGGWRAWPTASWCCRRAAGAPIPDGGVIGSTARARWSTSTRCSTDSTPPRARTSRACCASASARSRARARRPTRLSLPQPGARPDMPSSPRSWCATRLRCAAWCAPRPRCRARSRAATRTWQGVSNTAASLRAVASERERWAGRWRAPRGAAHVRAEAGPSERRHRVGERTPCRWRGCWPSRGRCWRRAARWCATCDPCWATCARRLNAFPPAGADHGAEPARHHAHGARDAADPQGPSPLRAGGGGRFRRRVLRHDRRQLRRQRPLRADRAVVRDRFDSRRHDHRLPDRADRRYRHRGRARRGPLEPLGRRHGPVRPTHDKQP